MGIWREWCKGRGFVGRSMLRLLEYLGRCVLLVSCVQSCQFGALGWEKRYILEILSFQHPRITGSNGTLAPEVEQIQASQHTARTVLISTQTPRIHPAAQPPQSLEQFTEVDPLPSTSSLALFSSSTRNSEASFEPRFPRLSLLLQRSSSAAPPLK
ncbi:hypothetical protein IQ07DRAFT_426047 [Pyrenochaeta sp. DS3sAY3a]|nr:hypothetical protein IQ07DRAFT_426047 [Pyrenochaeta sp. DS3sAY3a]